METKEKVGHTPGPWEYVEYGGAKVPTVQKVNGDIIGHFAHSEANARLIAGAPELLEALKRARPHIGVGYSAIQRHQIMSMVDAAIAKAEGRP